MGLLIFEVGGECSHYCTIPAPQIQKELPIQLPNLPSGTWTEIFSMLLRDSAPSCTLGKLLIEDGRELVPCFRRAISRITRPLVRYKKKKRRREKSIRQEETYYNTIYFGIFIHCKLSFPQLELGMTKFKVLKRMQALVFSFVVLSRQWCGRGEG